jgi:hypothetical protein
MDGLDENILAVIEAPRLRLLSTVWYVPYSIFIQSEIRATILAEADEFHTH